MFHDSNTFHVLIYLVTSQINTSSLTDSNTSHVLIYQAQKPIKYQFVPFKYISCSYLSAPLKNPASQANNSNTSHVLIYPKIKATSTNLEFNSNTSHVLIYRLANCEAVVDINSNTSHVLIYHNVVTTIHNP